MKTEVRQKERVNNINYNLMAQNTELMETQFEQTNRIEELEGALKNAYAIKELSEIHFKDTDEYYGIVDLCDEQIKHLEVNK